jgi:hypothetical protein
VGVDPVRPGEGTVRVEDHRSAVEPLQHRETAIEQSGCDVCGGVSVAVVDPGLEVDAKPIRDAVDIGVVADHLAYVEDIPIRETSRYQSGDVVLDHRRWLDGQLLGESEHRGSFLVETGGPPICFDGGEEAIILEESAQTAPVVGYSVVALVDPAHDEGDEFTLNLAQGLASSHR